MGDLLTGFIGPAARREALSREAERRVRLRFHLAQFAQGFVERDALILELENPASYRLQEQAQLFRARRVRVVQIKILLDVTQRESEFLTAQNQDHAAPVALGVDAVVAGPLGRNQALGLVEADRPGAHAQVETELRHGKELFGRIDHWQYSATP